MEVNFSAGISTSSITNTMLNKGFKPDRCMNVCVTEVDYGRTLYRDTCFHGTTREYTRNSRVETPVEVDPPRINGR
jgi:hypothetical protein